MISKTALQSFKKIWEEEFHESIDDQRAMKLGTSLLSLFDRIYRPVKKEWLDEAISDDKKFIEKTKI